MTTNGRDSEGRELWKGVKVNPSKQTGYGGDTNPPWTEVCSKIAPCVDCTSSCHPIIRNLGKSDFSYFRPPRRPFLRRTEKTVSKIFGKRTRDLPRPPLNIGDLNDRDRTRVFPLGRNPTPSTVTSVSSVGLSLS